MEILPAPDEEQEAALAPLVLAGDGLEIWQPVATGRPDQHAPTVFLRSLSKGSERAMRGALDTIARAASGGALDHSTFPWHEIRFNHASMIRAYLADEFSPAYANKILAALRGVLKSAWRLGQIETEAYQRAIDIAPVKGSTLPAGRMLTQGELLSLFQACANENGAGGSRDAAILCVLAGAGLRRSEVAALELRDYNAATGALRIRSGKGNKERETYLGEVARDAIDYWLTQRGVGAGALFVGLMRGRKKADGTSKRLADPKLPGLTDQAIMAILLKRSDEAAIDDCSPHDFRRTFISNALDAGVDLVTVQGMVGHSNPATTSRYNRRGEETKRRAASMIPIPYVPPKSRELAAQKSKRRKRTT